MAGNLAYEGGLTTVLNCTHGREEITALPCFSNFRKTDLFQLFGRVLGEEMLEVFHSANDIHIHDELFQ